MQYANTTSEISCINKDVLKDGNNMIDTCNNRKCVIEW